MKKIFLVLLFLLVGFSSYTENVTFSWSPYPVVPQFYTLSWGPSSYNFTNSVQCSTNCVTVSNLLSNTIYYFTVTVTENNQTSLFSRQLIIGPNPVGTNSLYIDSQLVYGSNLSSLQTNLVELESFNGYNPGTFFAGSLIINNNPLFNMNTAGDNATYLGEQIIYGTSLFNTVTDTIPVFIDLNIGNFYSSSIVLTNNSL